MKRAALFSLLMVLACSEDYRLPTDAPPPQPQPSSGVGGIGGYVFAGTFGNCLAGARIEIIDGARAGEAIVQKDCPYGDDFGYTFWNLPLDKQVTIRASAPGYASLDIRGFPAERVYQTNFTLSRE